MAIEHFEHLSKSEAQELLLVFMEDGMENIDVVIAHAEATGVKCDYSIDSLVPFLHWALSTMRTLPKEPDLSVPKWIRNTDDYQKGLFSFDDPSKNLVCFAAYYFGDCFVRNYSQLTWGTGNVEYAGANMPVVTGFPNEIELAPMWVLTNVFRRIIAEPEKSNDIDTMVNRWRGYVEA